MSNEHIAIRVGHGYDLHRLVPGRALVLGGVEIPYEKGLLGHSDADAAIHALCDAMLGAAALGDIGALFPDTDPQYEGISSVILLERVTAALAGAGYVLGNADLTIIAQAPKMAPYIPRMREIIARATSCPVGRISVKATTEEGLGATGAGGAIACHAVALIVCKREK